MLTAYVDTSSRGVERQGLVDRRAPVELVAEHELLALDPERRGLVDLEGEGSAPLSTFSISSSQDRVPTWTVSAGSRRAVGVAGALVRGHGAVGSAAGCAGDARRTVAARDRQAVRLGATAG